jgi:hypothetical protein
MVPVNVNDAVQVKLTILGVAHLTALGYPYRAPDVDGWTTFQLHELMAVFGTAMSGGTFHPPFLPDILVAVPS